jgi:hypothetical protein
MLAASWALLGTLQVATIAARAIARSTAGPAIPPAMPMLTNTPAPTIEPMSIMVAPNTPTSRFSFPLVAVSVIAP